MVRGRAAYRSAPSSRVSSGATRGADAEHRDLGGQFGGGTDEWVWPKAGAVAGVQARAAVRIWSARSAVNSARAVK